MSTREEALEAAAREYLRYRTTEARANLAAALAQPVQPADRTAEFLAGRDLTEGKYAHPVQPAPEPVGRVFTNRATRPTRPNGISQKIEWFKHPGPVGTLLYAAEPLVQPAGDAAWLPDWIQSLRADTGHFVSAEAAADLAEQVRRKFAEAQPVCELTRLRGVLLEIVREDAEGRGYFAAIALKALRADTQPAGDVRPTSFSTEEVMVLTDYLTERTAKALQRPAGEDRADALRDALTGLLDHCADQGWWMEVHAVKVMDNARAVLAETQRPAPDKPAPGSTQ